MSTEANKDLWRRFVETFNQGNLAAFDDLFTPEFRPRDTVMPIPPGPVGMQQLAGVVRSAFSDAHETIEDLIAEGDKVMMYATLRGTHTGAFLGIAPTGKAVAWKVVVIGRVANGKFAEIWQVHDQLGLLQQLGATITLPVQAPT